MTTSTTTPLRLLVVDDDDILRRTLAARFTKLGAAVTTASDAEEALDQSSDSVWDVALLDLHMPGMDGLSLLERLKEKQPALEVLVLTAHATIENAIRAMKLGAYNYLTKPFQFQELEVQVQKAFEVSQLNRREKQRLEHLDYESPRYQLIGSSQPMQRVVKMIERVAPTDASVLIRGGSGTGKELVARAIHLNSERRNSPLVTINCAALQETLLENELFGHEKGAFTGALQAKHGLIEVANGGTLFIDEIAEMGPGLQAKLLRCLEDGHYRRVGSTRDMHANVRLVAATNKPLEEEIAALRFREDLYYRLNVVSINLPPLSERREDIPELVEHFLLTRQIGPVRFEVDSKAMEALTQYSWPGNVRELANVLERAQILAEDYAIRLQDLPESLQKRPKYVSSTNGDVQKLEEVEKQHVERILRQHGGNKNRSARALGVSRRSLYRLIEKYELNHVGKQTEHCCARA